MSCQHDELLVTELLTYSLTHLHASTRISLINSTNKQMHELISSHAKYTNLFNVLQSCKY